MDPFALLPDEPFALGFLSEPSGNLTKKTAAGFLAAVRTYVPVISEKTGLADCFFPASPARVRFSFESGVYGDDDLLVKAEERPEYADAYRALAKKIAPYVAMNAVARTRTEEDLDRIETRCCTGGGYLGHAVPNYADFAKYGTDGLRKKVAAFREKNPRASEFYDGLLTFLDAFDELGVRLRQSAQAMLPSLRDPDAVRKITRLIRTLEHCPKEPARSFAEAVIVFSMAFTVEDTDSPGWFDQEMIGFWRQSDRVESEEALGDLWEFFHEIRAWNLTIGGSDENGADLTNELTFAILETAARHRYQTPNLMLRCHKNTPNAVWRAAADCLATGCGLPALYHDEAVCPALESLGIPPRDAHAYCMNGCNQIDIQGKSHMGLEDGDVNLGKAVELTLNRGICAVTGKPVGCRTPDPSSFGTFGDFYLALRDQIHFLCMESIHLANKSQCAAAAHVSDPLRSLTIGGCLEKGREYKDGGPLYGHGQILIHGLSNCVDSVCAVKKYVYEEKRFSITELCDALRADFEGYEEIWQVLASSPYRFGNDLGEVDALAADIVDDFNRFLRRFPTFRGGFYGGGCSPYIYSEDNAAMTGALPDGKRACRGPYADSIGATPGRDTHGPTALLNSCLAFDHTLPASGFILNIKFDRDSFRSETGIRNFIAMARAYFEGGGQQLSVTVVSEEDLLDACVHPDDHRDLIVRVGGYSDYFVHLDDALKENVIRRTCHRADP